MNAKIDGRRHRPFFSSRLHVSVAFFVYCRLYTGHRILAWPVGSGWLRLYQFPTNNANNAWRVRPVTASDPSQTMTNGERNPLSWTNCRTSKPGRASNLTWPVST
ncbi:hypothetical protein pneo_cds_756 [Pandoravirus neocaledonia]|uniref:Uncharacterized protein n=1 Tax=Pandoravirus neocaledonia TaxID=2107708 RepID=A0A2U7UD51_9VIRU|nr:hypothetical protein pneo_cds_756 [Pandoravirus neocaledonia]AVK76363.1 hypothetical protein pneo_cds_756 [Pandoravirus neocaledonia]